MAAIRLLQELEFEGLQASPEQQEILSRYVGWGGLADAFDENKPNWSDEFAELYATLSPEEYAAARASTLNAHYTSPTVIKAIYEAVGNMGFQSGNILEPSMGRLANFFVRTSRRRQCDGTDTNERPYRYRVGRRRTDDDLPTRNRVFTSEPNDVLYLLTRTGTGR